MTWWLDVVGQGMKDVSCNLSLALRLRGEGFQFSPLQSCPASHLETVQGQLALPRTALRLVVLELLNKGSMILKQDPARRVVDRLAACHNQISIAL